MKHYLLSTLILVIASPVIMFAQTLPNIQEKSMRAPKTVKIDGKTAEWDDKFEAYNHANDIFYTISNDDSNLYLTVKATNHTIINKILGGGIVFTIDTLKNKNQKSGMSFKYPLFDINTPVWVDLAAQPHGTSQQEISQADSVMTIKNRDFSNKSKTIGVRGVNGIDTVISVYNHDGVKAAGSFNRQLFFSCEIAISLKILGLTTTKPAEFKYNVRLPGVNMAAVYAAKGQATTVTAQGYVVPVGPLPGFTEEYIDKNQPSFPHKVSVIVFTASTDFWGDYRLATK